MYNIAKVMVVASIHGRLATSTYFTYDDLYSLVNRFRPDFVGVEIRQEDLYRGSAYLARNYPVEMVHLSQLYSDRVFGFDWLGDELTGRAIPNDWWNVESPIKRLERTIDDSAWVRDRRIAAARLMALAEKQE